MKSAHELKSELARKLARKLARGHKRLLPLIDHALNEGWEVYRTRGGHLKFTRPGLPAIYTGANASDHRERRTPGPACDDAGGMPEGDADG